MSGLFVVIRVLSGEGQGQNRVIKVEQMRRPLKDKNFNEKTKYYIKDANTPNKFYKASILYIEDSKVAAVRKLNENPTRNRRPPAHLLQSDSEVNLSDGESFSKRSSTGSIPPHAIKKEMGLLRSMSLVDRDAQNKRLDKIDLTSSKDKRDGAVHLNSVTLDKQTAVPKIPVEKNLKDTKKSKKVENLKKSEKILTDDYRRNTNSEKVIDSEVPSDDQQSERMVENEEIVSSNKDLLEDKIGNDSRLEQIVDSNVTIGDNHRTENKDKCELSEKPKVFPKVLKDVKVHNPDICSSGMKKKYEDIKGLKKQIEGLEKDLEKEKEAKRGMKDKHNDLKEQHKDRGGWGEFG